jgi:DNA-directed RNA polymerase III subunit RPC3
MNYARYLRVLVRSQFGSIVEQVFDCLLSKGPLNLTQLINQSNLPANIVKTCLISLIQHSIVYTSYEKLNLNPNNAAQNLTDEQRLGVSVYYNVNSEILRLRSLFPFEIQSIRALFGVEGEYLITTLSCHGCLTSTQLIDHSITLISNRIRGHSAKLNTEQLKQQLIKVANKILQQGFIHKAQQIDSHAVLSNNPENNSASTTNSSVAAAPTATKRKRATESEKKTTKAKKTNKSAAASNNNADDSDEGEAEIYSDKNISLGGENNGDLDLETLDISADEITLYTINHSRFLAVFRHQRIEEYVLDRMGATAASIIKLIIKHYPQSFKGRRPQPLSAQNIFDLIEREKEKNSSNSRAESNNNFPSLTLVELERELEEIATDPTEFFEFRRQANGYVVRAEKLFQELQLREIQSICGQKFSPLAARIYRLLIEKKLLEETQIAELAIAPRKAVRELLYLLLRGNFVSIQEIPRSTDRLPNRTFYVWGVSLEKSRETVLDALYFSLHNLLCRMELENSKIKNLVEKVEMEKTITEEEKKRIEKWKIGADRMEIAALKLNKTALLFTHF